MRKSIRQICFVAFILIIISCLILLLVRRLTKPICHELPQREIEQMLKRFTGRGLPSQTEDLRAIFYSYRGEEIFLAFQTDQEGCSYILDEFVGQDVLMQEFPHEEYSRLRCNVASFRKGYCMQERLGVVLFDMDLINRIGRDALEYANTGRYPKDAVTGHYLKFIDSSKLASYWVLIFKDRGIVYITAAKVP